VGTGFLLIKRKVFEILTDSGVPYPFDPLPISEGVKNWENHPSNFMPEDVSFCIRIALLGLEIWIAPSVKVGHIGTWNYKAEDH
jgi:hypothetical protein